VSGVMLTTARGGAPGTVSMASTYTVTYDAPGPGTAIITFESDGDVINTTLGSDVGDWLAPKSFAPSLYEIRATIVSGSLTSGSSATGSWLALTSDRNWRRLSGALNTLTTCVLTIEIRYAGGPVLDTATVTLNATRR